MRKVGDPNLHANTDHDARSKGQRTECIIAGDRIERFLDAAITENAERYGIQSTQNAVPRLVEALVLNLLPQRERLKLRGLDLVAQA